MEKIDLNKRCKVNKVIIAFTFFIVIGTLGAIWFSTFNYYYKGLKNNKISMDRLPVGSFQESHDSPDKRYTINSYICSSGTLNDWAARCELVDNLSGNIKNIYWDYKIETVDIKWINGNAVSINGHHINVEKEVYDWRKE
ncbi:DUF5412 family protein [Clostridium sp. LIBA-8841]|uniref:DUF5412 family protein n=1 Tax=Clostridium sp. LIBA-8841 TaxID=2987530 RepID=UPI002AC452C1|nr:DUF5412 family protein [Clostridium sp. LIBA-8841]MDZ5253871.1 DUF5412 domain-containing protein [Clostridium sp. LIBA-8841]